MSWFCYDLGNCWFCYDLGNLLTKLIKKNLLTKLDLINLLGENCRVTCLLADLMFSIVYLPSVY